jgi:hypothetical protein
LPLIRWVKSPIGDDAVKSTLVPLQMSRFEAEIFIVGIKTGFTVIVSILLVTVARDGHVALEVISTYTLSPLVRVVVYKLGYLNPL